MRMDILHILPVFMLATIVSCSHMEEPQPSGKGLFFSFGDMDITVKSGTEQGDGSLNENTVSTVSIFIFKEDGERTFYKELTADAEMPSLSGGTLIAGDWKNEQTVFPDPDKEYSAYAVANYHGNADLSGIADRNTLLRTLDSDINIFSTHNAVTPKTFTMSGRYQFVPAEAEDSFTIPLTLDRLAAKITVNIKFSESLKEELTPDGFSSRMTNYASNALLFPDREALYHDKGYWTQTEYSQPHTQEIPAATATFINYTYPNSWGTNALDETYMQLKISGRKAGSSDIADYFYKIPLRIGTSADDLKLDRNTIYRVNVTVDRLGSSVPDQPVLLTDIEFKVMEWVSNTGWVHEDIDVSDQNVQYLELLKDEIIMKNTDYSDEQYFTSSSPIDLSQSSFSAYYYDEMGQKVFLSESDFESMNVSISLSSKENEGKIQIRSAVPRNNGIRYFDVTVKNTDGISKSFRIKQYPLEYIVPVQGFNSYREDITVPESWREWVVKEDEISPVIDPNSIINYDFILNHKTYLVKQTFGTDYSFPTSYEDGIFTCAYYDSKNEEIYSLGYQQKDWYNNTWWMEYEYTLTPINPRAYNNNMYFIRITNTSDTYQLSVPKRTAEGYTDPSAENARLVSPAFMLASQLGSVQSMNHTMAKEHCNKYVEVSMDRAVYNDWRLPTQAELGIIDKFQNTPGSVIATVLGGKYYWAADNYFITENGSDGSTTRAYIRCIRDVRPDEPIMSEDNK